MESIIVYLDELEDLLDASRPVPFSGKSAINKDEVFEILNDIRLNLPAEIRQAQRIATDCDKIVNDATNKANAIIREAEEKADFMIRDHEITKAAQEEAMQIVEEARHTSRQIRGGAREYADELLANTEQVIRSTLESYAKHSREVEDYLTRELDTIYENRQELRGE